MFGSSILEVAAGMVFVYLFLSLICTSINEGISSFLNQRGKNLLEGIKNLLNDPDFTGLASQVYSHGLVGAISKNSADPDKKTGLPSYIPSGVFAMSIIDILGAPVQRGDTQARKKEFDDAAALVRQDASPENRQKLDQAQAALDAANNAIVAGRAFLAQHPDPLGELQKSIASLPANHTRESLLVLVDKTRREATREAAIANTGIASAEQQLEKFQENVEGWFNDSMDRASGWYKRWSQKLVLVIAAALIVLGNADSLMLARRFMRDGTLRAALVTAAEKSAQPSVPAGAAPAGAPQAGAQPGGDTSARGYSPEVLIGTAEKLDLPLGWVCPREDKSRFLWNGVFSRWCPDNAHLANASQASPALPTDALNMVPLDPLGWLVKLFGLAVSIFAVSMGAPFWFDTLSRIVNLRSSGNPPAAPQKS